MRLNLFTFCPEGGPVFELWAPREMRHVDAPESAGALVAEPAEGFAPNLIVGHDRVSADMSLDALAARLEADAAALPGAEPRAGRTVAGIAGEVRIVAFTHAGRRNSGPLYHVTACLFAPLPDAYGEQDGSVRQADASGERDLIYLTGTCTVDQIPTCLLGRARARCRDPGRAALSARSACPTNPCPPPVGFRAQRSGANCAPSGRRRVEWRPAAAVRVWIRTARVDRPGWSHGAHGHGGGA